MQAISEFIVCFLGYGSVVVALVTFLVLAIFQPTKEKSDEVNDELAKLDSK